MVTVECHEGLRKLADTFGSSLSSDKVDQYYEIFSAVSASDWIRTCDRARVTCERFPVPKLLNEMLQESGAWKRVPSPFSMRVFDCPKCLLSFAFNPMGEGNVIPCPGQFYNSDDTGIPRVCNMTYDKQYLIANSVVAR
jgi:hypothetical protein